jgi:hypothetical protein
MHGYGRSIIAAVGLAGGLAACRAGAPLVPVVGPKHAVAPLAGHWAGEYGSPLTGRSGTIDLTIADEGDSASGVVVMIPADFGQPLLPWRDTVFDVGPRSDALSTFLTIRLIWVEGTRVTGVLAPYADPQTGTRLITTFEGRVAGDTIAGTFVTHPGPTPGGETGRWFVTRERS